MLAQRELETDIAHDGRATHRCRLAGGLHAGTDARTSAVDRVAVDDVTVVIDEDRAVAVAVELRRRGDSRARRPCARASRDAVDPQARLMLRPSGRLPMTIGSKPRLLLEQLGRHDCGRAVRAVDRDRERRHRRGSSEKTVRSDDADTRRRDLRAAPARFLLAGCAALHAASATIASRTSRPIASPNFSPLPENTLMPLALRTNLLCDAEITTPASVGARPREG